MSEISIIDSKLSIGLSDDPVVLTEQLTEIEKYYARIGNLLSLARSELIKAQIKSFPKKTKDMTEKERELIMASSTTTEREAVEQLEILLKAITQRVSFGQSLLKKHMMEPR